MITEAAYWWYHMITEAADWWYHMTIVATDWWCHMTIEAVVGTTFSLRLRQCMWWSIHMSCHC